MIFHNLSSFSQVNGHYCIILCLMCSLLKLSIASTDTKICHTQEKVVEEKLKVCSEYVVQRSRRKYTHKTENVLEEKQARRREEIVG